MNELGLPLLAELGFLLLCLRMKYPSRKFMVAPGFTKEEVEEVQGLVRGAGFCNIQTERRQLEREATCVMATR